jgi:hypothetical protein
MREDLANFETILIAALLELRIDPRPDVAVEKRDSFSWKTDHGSERKGSALIQTKQNALVTVTKLMAPDRLTAPGPCPFPSKVSCAKYFWHPALSPDRH